MGVSIRTGKSRLAIPPGEKATDFLSDTVPGRRVLQEPDLILGKLVRKVASLQLQGGAPIRIASGDENPLPEAPRGRRPEYRGGEIDETGLARLIQDHIPVVQIPLGHAGLVNGLKELFKLQEKPGGEIPLPQAGEVVASDEIDGEGLGIHAPGEARNAAYALKTAVGCAFPFQQVTSDRDPEPRRAPGVVLDGETTLGRLPNQYVRLGPVSTLPERWEIPH
jgi:hypothetical protein